MISKQQSDILIIFELKRKVHLREKEMFY